MCAHEQKGGKKNPQCSCVATGTYRLLCFLKARGKRGKANKSDEIMGMKGDGGEGFNAGFLWPEDLLNSCLCRKTLSRCSSIYASFPVNGDVIGARCIPPASTERTTDDAGGQTQKSGFLKTVIPHNSSAASQILFFLFVFNNGGRVSHSIWHVWGGRGCGGVTNLTGCSTSWKCGPMWPSYVTLSACHFHFGKRT